MRTECTAAWRLAMRTTCTESADCSSMKACKFIPRRVRTRGRNLYGSVLRRLPAKRSLTSSGACTCPSKLPPHSLPQLGDVRDVVLAMPGVERDIFVELHHS